jgi:hypothetical protein
MVLCCNLCCFLSLADGKFTNVDCSEDVVILFVYEFYTELYEMVG